MWMGDVEKAMDAYRVFLQVKIDIASNEDSHDSYCPPEANAFEEALRVFNIIFTAGEENEKQYDFGSEEIEQDIRDAVRAVREECPSKD